MAELARRTLLEWYTPAAVTVDRDNHVLYHHGDTSPFLRQPQGEPSRDLLVQARDGVRAAVRVALHRAAADGKRATAPDGWMDAAPNRRVRVRVTAAQVLDAGGVGAAPECYVVGFEDLGDIAPPAAPGGEGTDEVRRLQGELQSTIEELQTSNEEMRASNEEVMSVNEELLSANEELETSKEEMQSLNEELRTVNSQLRAKMEEHQGASSDLASLLTSTDIAVLFLDREFRIRRYTPAVRDLVDLIPGDIGRALAAMARRFDDPHLDGDCQAVLERLVPVARELAAANGRYYLRRVLAYRTVDDRIDGVVVTFVDVTDGKRAGEALRAGEERLRLAVAAAELATWDWDVATGRVVWNDAHFDMLGYAPGGAAPSYEAWRARVHPGDRPAAEAALAAARDARAPYHHEFRVVHPDGAVRTMSARGTFSYDGAGAPVRMIGVMRDVTDQRATEAALRRSEERLRLALVAARMGTWTWDVAADEHRRDAGLNALFGLPAADTVSPFAEFLTHIHPDDRGAVRAAFDQTVRHGRPLSVEFRAVRPDGAVRWLRDQGDVFGTAGQARLAGACVDVTDLKEAEAALRRANDELEGRVAERTGELERALDALGAEMARRQDMARRLASAQEDERRRVSRDLHDSVGQLLTGLSLAFKAVETFGELPAPAAGSLADAQRIMSDLGRELHGVAVRLRLTSLDDIGLEPALGQLVSDWAARAGVRAELHAPGLAAGRLPAEVETVVYRVVQEALTNVARHAVATAAGVVVTRSDGHVSVVVEDDGAGFDAAAPPPGRLGLLGMRERVELVGGTMDIESSPGAGTAVAVRIPVRAREGGP